MDVVCSNVIFLHAPVQLYELLQNFQIYCCEITYVYLILLPVCMGWRAVCCASILSPSNQKWFAHKGEQLLTCKSFLYYTKIGLWDF